MRMDPSLRSKLVEQTERKHLEQSAEAVLHFKHAQKIKMEEFEQQAQERAEFEAKQAQERAKLEAKVQTLNPKPWTLSPNP